VITRPKSSFAVIAVIASFAAASPILAHHSFSLEFDATKPVTFKGVVTKVEWMSPHVYFSVDVKQGPSKVVNWVFESAGPTALARRGWNRNSLKIGDRITVIAYRAKDDVHVASAREVVLADGRKLIAASPNDGGPQF
jgi:Family of unknown function (DUF6152)